MRCLFGLLGVLLVTGSIRAQSKDEPRSLDPRLEIRLFAAAPQIVHPIALDFDARGRLLVIESHTHFPPKEYKGLPHDRVLCLEDTDGDGKADRITTFFEGTKKSMDLAVHPDGSVYLATRNEILRLRDTDGDGKADESKRVVFLETDGDYPHNGLSGLAFDSRGDLVFGMGENLGASYKLIAADGAVHAGGGEGGNVFWCTRDGARLRRVATGFWNPFGTCRDIFDRWFSVDNDPDASPPCRLLHLVDGADYGFQFRYGRSGRHPFQSWNGELPGTLPYVHGTGESPCEVLSYESDGLPVEYRGDLLVTSWADHRLERYTLTPKGASFGARQKIVIQGGTDFRPVGLAVAPDGSLFLSDWVRRDYTLHNRGAIWQVRMKDAPKSLRPADPRQAILSRHRPLRDAAARTLGEEPRGRDLLRELVRHADVRVRASALTTLVDRKDTKVDLAGVVLSDPEVGMQTMAVRALVERGKLPAAVHDKVAATPPLLREAVQLLDPDPLLELLRSPDVFLRQAAVHALAHSPNLLADLTPPSIMDAKIRLGVLQALRESERPAHRRWLADFLADPSDDVRLLAARWVSDLQLTEFRANIDRGLASPQMTSRLYLAFATALARLNNEPVNEGRLADIFLKRVLDPKAPTVQRVFALRMVPTTFGGLKPEILGRLVEAGEPPLRLEAVQALTDHLHPQRLPILVKLAFDKDADSSLRAQAILALAPDARSRVPALLGVAESDDSGLAAEALRALLHVDLDAAQKKQIDELGDRQRPLRSIADRVLGRPFHAPRPDAREPAAWQDVLAGRADAEAGRRVFFHPKLAGCFRCHRVDGRGRDIGPDLSAIGQRDRGFILESILQPSREVAPHYQTWQVETSDGKVRNGLLVHTQLDEVRYVDEKGEPYTVNTRDVVETRAVPMSIMPEGLVEQLTDQELRDLLAYLASRK